MRAASSGLRHPASASCLGRHSHLAGRCPNSCSLFPPLAAVVVVAAERLFLIEQCRSVCGRSGIAFSQVGSWRKTAAVAPLSAKARRCGESGLALSVTCGDSSPKGRAKSTAGNFLITLKTLATSITAWLSLRGKTSPAPGEDVTVGDKRGNLARERLRGRARLSGAAPHPALRATFPQRVKASAVAGNFAAASKGSPLGELSRSD